MLRRLRHHIADVIEATTPRAARDLMKIARRERRHLLPAVLAQAGEQDRANGHIHPHAQRVRAADDLQQTALRKLLHQHPILRQQARVVNAHAMAEVLLHLLAIRAGELRSHHRFLDRRLLRSRAEVQTHEVLRSLRRFILREVNEIHRGLVRRDQLLQGHIHRGFHVAELQRHRPLLRRHHRGLRPRQLAELFLEEVGRAHGRRHEQEARLAHREQGHLPGHAALAVRVVVELVHDHLAERCVLAITQRVVCQDLRRAAEDGSLAVHRRVPGRHAHVVGTKVTT